MIVHRNKTFSIYVILQLLCDLIQLISCCFRGFLQCNSICSKMTIPYFFLTLVVVYLHILFLCKREHYASKFNLNLVNFGFVLNVSFIFVQFRLICFYSANWSSILQNSCIKCISNFKVSQFMLPHYIYYSPTNTSFSESFCIASFVRFFAINMAYNIDCKVRKI